MGIAILDRLAGKLAKKKEAKAKTYRQLVFDVAGGKEPPADEVEQLLTAAGASFDVFRQAVALRHRRAAIRPDLKKGEGVAPERAEIAAAAAAANADLGAAQAKHADIMARLQERQRAAEVVDTAAAKARAELLDSCDTPELLAEREDLRRRQADARQRAQLIGEDIGRLQKKLAQAETGANATGYAESNKEPYRQQAMSLAEAIAARQPDMAAARQEVARLEAEERGLELKMIEAP